MDQTTTLSTYDRRRASDHLANSVVQSIESARAVEKPFFHLEFDRVFPDDTYAQILALMPESADYRPMHGRSKGQDLDDGTHTRVKIDLFPEYIRNLPPEKRALWDVVGRALCSEPSSKLSSAGWRPAFQNVLATTSLRSACIQFRSSPATFLAI